MPTNNNPFPYESCRGEIGGGEQKDTQSDGEWIRGTEEGVKESRKDREKGGNMAVRSLQHGRISIRSRNLRQKSSGRLCQEI